MKDIIKNEQTGKFDKSSVVGNGTELLIGSTETYDTVGGFVSTGENDFGI